MKKINFIGWLFWLSAATIMSVYFGLKYGFIPEGNEVLLRWLTVSALIVVLIVVGGIFTSKIKPED